MHCGFQENITNNITLMQTKSIVNTGLQLPTGRIMWIVLIFCVKAVERSASLRADVGPFFLLLLLAAGKDTDYRFLPDCCEVNASEFPGCGLSSFCHPRGT